MSVIQLSGGYMDRLRSLGTLTDTFNRFINGEATYREWDDDLCDYRTSPVPTVEFDTVVATGVSGLMCLPLFAQAAKCEWLAIRKPKDGSHSSVIAEGTLGERWLFVDDFISSGQTLAKVVATTSRIAKQYGHRTEFVGAYQYERMDYYGFEDRARCVRKYLQRDWVWNRETLSVEFDYNRSTVGRRVGDTRPSVLDLMIEVMP